MQRTVPLNLRSAPISNSQRTWLDYNVFAVATLSVLGGGYPLLRRAGLSGADYGLALLGVLILAANRVGISITCHILGHIVDALDEIHQSPPSNEFRTE